MSFRWPLSPFGSDAPGPARSPSPTRRGRTTPAVLAIDGRPLAGSHGRAGRYAREVVLAIDDLLHARGRRGRLLLPAGTRAPNRFDALDTIPVPGAQEAFWEQVCLPWRAGAPLLSLGGTAPLAGPLPVVCVPGADDPRAAGTARLLHRMLAHRGARFATASRRGARRLARALGLDEAAIAVLPHGHEHVFRWDPRRSTLLKAEPPRRRFVVAIGSPADRRAGSPLALAPALDHAGLDLLVAGGGAGAFAAVAAARRPNVRWLGHLPDDDWAALLGAAVALVVPDLAEGGAASLVEAMALGCPVVAADRADLAETGGPAVMLSPPGDPGPWLEHLTGLAASPERRADLAEAGRRQAATFSWRSTAAGYLALIEAAASPRPVAAPALRVRPASARGRGAAPLA